MSMRAKGCPELSSLGGEGSSSFGYTYNGLVVKSRLEFEDKRVYRGDGVDKEGGAFDVRLGLALEAAKDA